MKPLNFIFFGTPDIARETLEDLFQSGYIPKLIITSPDRPVGRKFTITPPPVKIWVQKHSIECLQPEKIDATFLEVLEEKKQYHAIDVFVVVAYGKILPEKLIHLPRYGTLNIHYSLLPRHRGACPTESAILSGDTETGVTIQSMVYELDAGDIVAQEKTTILPDETTPELRARLSIMGSQLLITTLENLESLLRNKTPQDTTGITKCGKIKKTDGEVMQSDDRETLYKKYRAYQPWPGIYYFDEQGKRIKITEMKRMHGIPKITKIIPEGGKEQNVLL